MRAGGQRFLVASHPLRVGLAYTIDTSACQSVCRAWELGLQQARLHHGVPASRNGRAIGDLQDPDALLCSTTSLVAKLFFSSVRFLYEMCYLDM